MKKILFLLTTILIISGCATTSQPQRADEEVEAYNRLTGNISIKEKGRYSITYEYKDVRVDDIAVLAARYCKETYNTQAHLKSVTLHKNNYRLATFHCHDLQE